MGPIGRHVPNLRRFARALTGSRRNGDDAVSAALRAVVVGRLPLDRHLPAQIARYNDDWSMLAVTCLNNDKVSLISPSFREQTAIKVGSQPMDMVYRGNEVFVACQGDGSVHIIDIETKRWKHSFQCGTGCESLGFY